MKTTERVKQWIFAAGCILFLVIANKCSGQTLRFHRYSKYPEITTFSPIHSMKFNDGNNDTIYVSILADSVGLHEYEYSILLCMPQQTKVSGYSLRIGFPKGNIITLYANTSYLKSNCNEYELSLEDIAMLQASNFDFVSFDKGEVEQPCINIKTKDFFVKFLNSLK